MFDIGFWELVVIGLVALLVVGPERLPRLAYSAGKWLGKGRAMIGSIKAEIDREIHAEELKRVVEEQKKVFNPLKEIIEETDESLSKFEEEINVISAGQDQAEQESDDGPGRDSNESTQ